jgi:hypothetical protein
MVEASRLRVDCSKEPTEVDVLTTCRGTSESNFLKDSRNLDSNDQTMTASNYDTKECG